MFEEPPSRRRYGAAGEGEGEDEDEKRSGKKRDKRRLKNFGEQQAGGVTGNDNDKRTFHGGRERKRILSLKFIYQISYPNAKGFGNSHQSIH